MTTEQLICGTFFACVGGALAVFSTILLLIFLGSKKLRQKPGDLYIGILVAKVLAGSRWAFQGFFILSPKSKYPMQLCLPESLTEQCAVDLFIFYGIALVAYYIMSIKYALKAGSAPWFALHLIPCILTGIHLSFYTIAAEQHQHHPVNTCQFPVDGLHFLVFHITLLLLSIYGMCYLHGRLNENTIPHLRKSLRSVSLHKKYLRYILLTTILQVSVRRISRFLMERGVYIGSDLTFYTVTRAFGMVILLRLVFICFRDPLVVDFLRNLFASKSEEETTISLNDAFAPRKTTYRDPLLGSLQADEKRDMRVISMEPMAMANLQSEKSDPGTDDPQIQSDFRISLSYSIISTLHLYSQLEAGTISKGDSKLLAVEKEDELILKESETLRRLSSMTKPNMGARFKFQAATIHPVAGEEFGKLFDLSEISRSLKPELNTHEILQAGDSRGAGRSGEFFFFSQDLAVVVKSISHAEAEVFTSIMKDYFEFLKVYPASYLVKFLGIFDISFPALQVGFKLVLMKNVNYKIPKVLVRATYDLKGSTVGRRSFTDKEVEEIKAQPSKVAKTGKDIDFLQIEGHLRLDATLSAALVNQLTLDSQFLFERNFMDYSLLITKFDTTPGQTFERYDKSRLIPSRKPGEENVAYSFGIIDFLQQYNMSKRLEKSFKTALDSQANVSVQPPQKYHQRFLNFLDEIIPNLSENSQWIG